MRKKKLLEPEAVSETVSEKILEPVEVALKEEYPRLSAEKYWEWRTTIAELETAKKAFEVAQLQLAAAKKDAEALALKAQIFSLSQLKSSELSLKEAEQEYANTKNQLEALLGISLNGKMIDAHTFEVKDAPK